VYRALLADEPGAWQALAGLGLCARLRRDLPASAEHLAAALAAAPRERAVRLEYATTLREQGRAADAEAVYRALLADEPGAWQALAGLGLCARLRNDRAGALAHFAAAVELAPDADAARLELAGEYRDAGRFDAARACLQPLLDRTPVDAQARLGLGLIERTAGDHAAALEAFRQGYADHPDRHQFLFELAAEQRALGDFAEAERLLLRASGIDGLAGAALTQLGEMARVARQLDKALELFRRAAPLPGAPAWVHAALAQTLAELGRPDEAFGVLDAAERQLGQLPETALRRAGLLRRAGFRHEALAVVRAAVALAPRHFPLWYEWFENERFSGDFAAIDACLAAAPAATPRDRAYLHHARGLVAEQRFQVDEAAAEFRQAIALDASLSWLYEALARVSLLRFDPATAREQLLVMRRLRAPIQRQQGLSEHLAHTHIGQILDEFLMDGAALEAIVAALAAPPEQRIGRLLARVRADPGHTPTAIALLLALRRAGAFAARHRETSAAVPKTIMQFWDQATPPPDVAALMRSWQDHNPGHRHVRFDDGAARAFLKAHCAPEVLRAYQRAREPAMKADLFRVAYLFVEGGCYADADDRCLRPIGELVPPWAGFAAFQEDFGTLGNNFLIATPLHPVLGLAARLAVQAINRGDDDLLWLATGPGLITRAFAEILATSTMAPPAWLERVAIFDRHEIERAVAIHCLLTYKNTERHWSLAAFGQPRPTPRPGTPAPGPTPAATT
jgi:Flp pilus assembly protein TadD